jgi:two-component system, NarL family, response regulator LiaR
MRLLLADDHAVVRDTLKSILRTHLDIEIVGEATNGEEAVRQASQLQPDVVVRDIVMPKLDGIAAAHQMQTLSPQTPIVGLSVHAKSYEVNAMLEAGAFEVISKEKAIEDLIWCGPESRHKCCCSRKPSQ